MKIVVDILSRLGVTSTKTPLAAVYDGVLWKASGELVDCINPATGQPLAKVQLGNTEDIHRCILNANEAKHLWAALPAPKRGEIIRQLGDELRRHKKDLGMLVSLEMGKILAEGLGEVQEYIDICDFSLGLSRTLQGLVLPSERSQHTLLEMYNPLGTVGIITAFNFPCAVAGWNSAISLVCGNTQVIKGAETTNLVNIATQKILTEVLRRNDVDTRVATLCQGQGSVVGEALISHKNVDLVSFTGSTHIGRHVQRVVGERFGKSLLELGGNNAVIISQHCDENLLQNALRSVIFGAVGTCGQRCTSTRRVLVHAKHYESFKANLVKSYHSINDLNSGKIGDPLKDTVLVGPLHTKVQLERFLRKVEEAKSQGGKILSGGNLVDTSNFPSHLREGFFVHPTVVEISHTQKIVYEENFMPIVHLIKINSLEEAIVLNNSVEQGLTSALFTSDMKEVFRWIGAQGSDCGIVNVNTGSSGAEIGGAFGGNKSTGGGRESGSDAWKSYMRRSTCTVNFGNALPLAQGIDFN